MDGHFEIAVRVPQQRPFDRMQSGPVDRLLHHMADPFQTAIAAGSNLESGQTELNPFHPNGHTLQFERNLKQLIEKTEKIRVI